MIFVDGIENVTNKKEVKKKKKFSGTICQSLCLKLDTLSIIMPNFTTIKIN